MSRSRSSSERCAVSAVAASSRCAFSAHGVAPSASKVAAAARSGSRESAGRRCRRSRIPCTSNMRACANGVSAPITAAACANAASASASSASTSSACARARAERSDEETATRASTTAVADDARGPAARRDAASRGVAAKRGAASRPGAAKRGGAGVAGDRDGLGEAVADEGAFVVGRRGLGEGVERGQGGVQVVGGVGRVERAAQVRERLGRAAGAERELAARLLDDGEHGRAADAERDALGRGRVALGARLVPAQRGDPRERRPGERAPQRLADLAAQRGGLLPVRPRPFQVRDAEPRVRGEREHLPEPRPPPLRAQLVRGAVEQRHGAVHVAGDEREVPAQRQRDGIGHASVRFPGARRRVEPRRATRRDTRGDIDGAAPPVDARPSPRDRRDAVGVAPRRPSRPGHGLARDRGAVAAGRLDLRRGAPPQAQGEVGVRARPRRGGQRRGGCAGAQRQQAGAAHGVEVCGHRRFDQTVGDLDAADLRRELRGRDQAAAALAARGSEVRGAAQPGRGAFVVTAPRASAARRPPAPPPARRRSRARSTTRCQVARSGSRAATTDANARWPAARAAGLDACRTAARVSGCANVNRSPSSSISPHATAGAKSDIRQLPPDQQRGGRQDVRAAARRRPAPPRARPPRSPASNASRPSANASSSTPVSGAQDPSSTPSPAPA